MSDVAVDSFLAEDTERVLWRLPALLLGVLAGTALQLQQAALWERRAYLGLLGLALLCGALGAWLVRRSWRARSARGLRWLRRGAWWLAFALGALAAFAGVGLRATAYLDDALLPALEGRDVHVTGVVAAMPQVSDAGLRFRFAVESAQLAGKAVPLPPLLELGWWGASLFDAPEGSELEDAGQAAAARATPKIAAGERWAMTVRLKAPHGVRNPYGFDTELWFWEQGVQATGYVRTGRRDEPPQRLARTWQYPIEQARQAVRDAIFARLLPTDAGAAQENPLAARAAGVVAALVTGDQRAIERADWDIFRATGVAHLMSISGLHITMFAWLAARLVRWAWGRSARLCLAVPAQSAALVAGVLLAAAYALFSGWGVPAQRTVTMLATLALLRLAGLRWPWPQVWLLACAAVVLADPWALLQAGFWLSFVAVGVLFASNVGAADERVKGVKGHFRALLREQWVVTLALTPLSLVLFGQIALVGLLANLLAIPWVTLLVTPLALAGVLCAPLWQLAAWALQPLLALLQWLAAWPQAVWFLPQAPLWAGVAAVCAGALLATRWPWGLRALALPLLLPVLCWQPARPAPGQFELLAADVGQGSAVLVRTATHSLLYDAGPRYGRAGMASDAGQRVLVPLLRALGERLDMLMLSHRDADHIGGAAAVLAQQPQAQLVGSIIDESALLALRPASRCLAGQRWVWDGVAFEVLYPQAKDVTQAAPATASMRSNPPTRSNASSCVLRISAAAAADGGHGAPITALLVGDIELAQEQTLLARGAAVATDWLLAAHHGSKSSSGAAFLDAAHPRTVMVQAGYRNRYGHPAPEVLARYAERHIRVVESTRCGAATWTSAAPDDVRCERTQRPRYWAHVPPTSSTRDEGHEGAASSLAAVAR